MKRWWKRVRSIQVYYGLEIDETGEIMGWFWHDNVEWAVDGFSKSKLGAYVDALMNRRR